ETAEQVGDHSGRWLATIADAAVAFDGAFWMIGTIFERVDMCPESRHVIGHPAVQRLHMTLFVEASRDARLIADDECKISGVVDRLDRLAGAVDPLQLARLKGVARVMIEDAVAVEE